MARQRNLMKLKGMQQLRRDLMALSKKLQGPPSTETLIAAAETIQEEAERLAPKRPGGGRLQDSFLIETDEKKKPASVRMGPDKDAFYSYFQELGTYKMSPHPFMRPALKGTKGLALQAASEKMRQTVAAGGIQRSSRPARAK